MSAALTAVPDIVGQVIEAKGRRIRVSPCHSNRASEAGHPCERYLVLCRTNWADRTPHDVGLEFIFEGGRLIEDMAIREMQDAGLAVVEQQRPFAWAKMEMTGHIDGKVIVGTEAFPFDVKGLQHHEWARLNEPRDFLDERAKPWTKKYPAQILMYLLMDGKERGFFYLKSKATMRPKIVWFDLRENWLLDHAEAVCKKLERVNAHVKAGTRPEPCGDPDLCSGCPFLHVCLPEIKQTAMEILDSGEIEEMLRRRAELDAAYREYQSIDKEVKAALEGKERAMIGDWLVTGKFVTRKGYAVPDSTYWQTKIVRLSETTARGAKGRTVPVQAEHL